MEKIVKKLEESLNLKIFDQSIIKQAEEVIINSLQTSDYINEFSILFDLYYKILQANNPNNCTTFRKRVYSIINSYVKQNKIVTLSMIIANVKFAVYDNELEEYVKEVTFSNNIDRSSYSRKKRMIRLATKDFEPARNVNKEAINIINIWLFVIANHEMSHAMQFKDSIQNDDYKDSSYELLYLMAERLLLSTSLYKSNHDLMIAEYWADIWGLFKTLDQIENHLPDFPLDKLEEYNYLFANSIMERNGYVNCEKVGLSARQTFETFYEENQKNNFDSIMYMPSTDFRIAELEELRRKGKLKEYQDDFLRLLNGDDSPLFDYIKLVANKSIRTTNLFHDLINENKKANKL